MKKTVVLGLALLILLSILPMGAVGSAQGKLRVIVGFKEAPDPGLVESFGGEIKYVYTVVPAIAARVPGEAVSELRKAKGVMYVEPDYRVQAIQELPWGVDRIDAEIVHSYNKGTGVKVAIIDTGIDYNHLDLDDNYEGGYDFVNDDADPMDDHGHGTHCAGIVAAEDNDFGVVGVAPEAHLHAVKVLDSGGSGYVSDVVAGIQWSKDNGMQVISMSLGSKSDSTTLHDACDAAYASGIILVAAAGNEGNPPGKGDNVLYPAGYSSVIAVVATDKNDERARWSSTGPDVELAAPGVDIKSTLLGGGYGEKSGTSMACPHVSGAAALIIVSDSSLANADVRQRLRDTADDLGPAGFDEKYGYGLVDADEAAPPPPAGLTISDLQASPDPFSPDGDSVKDVTTITATLSETADWKLTINNSAGETVKTFSGSGTLISADWDGTDESGAPVADGTYTIYADAVDADGNPAKMVSTTLTVDTVDPTITSGPTASEITATSATITWGTDEESDSLVEYGLETTYGSSEYDATLVTGHSITLTGLTASTTYHYKVTSKDAAGNAVSSSDHTFTTSEAVGNSMYVESITFGSKVAGPNKFLYTYVKVVDDAGNPLEGVRVEMTLEWDKEGDGTIVDSWNFAGDTDSTGVVKFTLLKAPSGYYTATVTGLTLTDYTWGVWLKIRGFL